AEDILGQGRPELAGRALQETLLAAGLLPPGEVLPSPGDAVRSVRLSGRRKDGAEFHGDLHLQAIDAGPGGGLVVQIDDVTERERARRNELRAQRMESIGTLAGGIAHDLNNALAPIAMGLELLRARYPQNVSLIDTMEKCTRRGAGMVKQLLTFARGSEGDRRSLQPRRIIDEMAQIIRSAFPKNITLEVELTPGLWDVLGDATQLHQVLLNLCVNARDAMPDGGTLSIEARNATVDETFASGTEGARAGNFVRWTVRDTGTGMPPEVIRRIFDPFFTTKEQGKGTGLGLSTVLGIVRSHLGFLRVESTPGLGSAFEIYLPAATTAPAAAAGEESAGTFRGNGETILVVDDEDTVREISRTVLTGLNFNVLLAGDGTEALIQVADHAAEIRLVITDYDMPHMNGQMLVPALRRMIPDARIVLASGTAPAGALLAQLLDGGLQRARALEALDLGGAPRAGVGRRRGRHLRASPAAGGAAVLALAAARGPQTRAPAAAAHR
ncbi:MAG: ATP-binding protein, partial [Opitutaceae bacterium]